MADLISGWIFAEAGHWMTLREACAAFGCTSRTVNRRITSGRLRAKVVDGVRFVLQVVEDELTGAEPRPRGSAGLQRRRRTPSA